jgi:hypothetical protein
MSQQFDILRRLQEYEVLPPTEVVAGLHTALNKTLNSSGDTIRSGNLERLAHLELQPPLSIRSSIEKIIAGAPLPATRPEEGKSGSGSIKRIFSPYASVAACVLLVIAVWTIYRASLPHRSVQVAATTQKTTPAPGNNGGPAATETADTSSEKSVAKNIPLSPDSSTGPGSKMIRIKQNPSFIVEGRYLPVTDNDLLITLTSFKYDEIPAFIDRKDDHDVRIRVDAYSNIYISKSMLQMIKDMYEVKSSGKPTRKARRGKAKLEQWKKKDEARFDQSPENNPLDPIDLARLIFK